ncbi:MAG: 50S ribosomal protein L23 [Candidatus Comchoanobacterales bacterium]
MKELTIRRINQVLLKPVITEKSTTNQETFNTITFEVGMDATKHEIAQAVYQLFGHRVIKVNTLRNKPKVKRTRTRFGGFGKTTFTKKAMVRLAEGETVTFDFTSISKKLKGDKL